MGKCRFAILATAVIGLGLVGSAHRTATARAQSNAPAMTASQTAGTMSIEVQNTLVATTCVTCHNDQGKAGGLSLQSFDAAKIEQNAEVAEKMIHKLRAGMMPPQTVRNRPDAVILQAFAASIEAPLDRAAAL